MGIILTISGVNVSSAEFLPTNKSGLGYSINAVTTEHLDLAEIRDGSPIFTESWLNSQLNSLNYMPINKSFTDVLTENSFEKVSKVISAFLGYSSSITASVDIFSATAENGFEMQKDASF